MVLSLIQAKDKKPQDAKTVIRTETNIKQPAVSEMSGTDAILNNIVAIYCQSEENNSYSDGKTFLDVHSVAQT